LFTSFYISLNLRISQERKKSFKPSRFLPHKLKMRVLIDQKNLIRNTELSEVKGISRDLPRVLQVRGKSFGSHTFIIESPNALQILLKPWIVGLELADLARKSSKNLLKVAYHLCPEFKTASYNKIAEVIPLAGALYYHLGDAFEHVFHESLKQCFIGAQRKLDQHKNQWFTKLSYLNFEALPSQPVILLGDTIATGGTIQKIIKTTAETADKPQAIILFSIAGSALGAHKLHKLERELDLPIYSFFSNALFGVAENGTDMPWLHPATLMSTDIRYKALETYGHKLGKEWCAIWDWGERAKDPQRHLEDLLERINYYLKKSGYENLKENLLILKTKVKESMEKRLAPIHL
jgi:hypothetical protein